MWWRCFTWVENSSSSVVGKYGKQDHGVCVLGFRHNEFTR